MNQRTLNPHIRPSDAREFMLVILLFILLVILLLYVLG